MRSDAELDRLVEDWLSEASRVLPPDVLNAVLDALPAARQRRRSFELSLRWQRRLTFAAVAALAVVVIVAAPNLVNLVGLHGPAATVDVGASPRTRCTPAVFEDARTISTAASGHGPMDVVAGDFNADRKPDLIVANEYSGDATIGVLLGRGDGTFGEPPGFPSGGASSLATVDANRDGKPDLVGIASSRDRLVVLLGDGLGGFRSPTEVPAGNHPAALTIADFNGDGIPDVGVALAGDSAVAIFRGDGNGAFRQVERLATDGVPSSVTAADFNGDGVTDIGVALSEAYHLEVFLGDPHGGFGVGRDVASRASFTVTAGDVNGDGRPDLVTGNHGEDGIGVLLGDGLGGFGPVEFVPVGGDRGIGPVILGHFAGDANVDIAAAADGNDSAVIALKGDGSGRFAVTAVIPVESGPLGIAAADLNEDGAPDVVTSDVNASAVSVLLGTCPAR